MYHCKQQSNVDCILLSGKRVNAFRHCIINICHQVCLFKVTYTTLHAICFVSVISIEVTLVVSNTEE